MAYDHVFVRISGIPIAAAAVSSSRIAIQARPEARVLQAPAAEDGEQEERDGGPVEELARFDSVRKTKSPKPSESIGLIP